MTVHLRVKRWWQRYVLGAFKSPQALYAAALYEEPDPANLADRFFELPSEGIQWNAPERLKAPAFMRTNTFLRQWDKADWQGVDPRLAYWSALFIEYARKRGIPLYVHCAFRSREEQERLRAAGRSNAGYPRSAHNIGEAVDVVHGVFHWDMTKQEWALLHVLGLLALDRVNATLKKPEQLKLTWGGSWTGLYDPAHWEISDFRGRLKPINAGPPIRRTPRSILRSSGGR